MNYEEMTADEINNYLAEQAHDNEQAEAAYQEHMQQLAAGEVFPVVTTDF